MLLTVYTGKGQPPECGSYRTARLL